jgi:hypothetical protein
VKVPESLPLDEWIAIAEGHREMPWSFQRFIGAWELVVAWHRTHNPNETSDAQLKNRLKSKLADLALGASDEWRTLVEPALPWEIFVMRGPIWTGNSVKVEAPEDISSIVDALYTVRCNLLKAGKSPSNSRDILVTDVAAWS